VCLAKAYLNERDDEPVLQDIARMQLQDSQVKLVTLFGEEKLIPSKVVEVDFVASRILLDEHRASDKIS
jgi:predicted RNA-binding protein